MKETIKELRGISDSLKMSEVCAKIREITGVQRVHWFLIDAIRYGSDDDIIRAIERERERG